MRTKFLQEPGLSELVYTVAMTSPISLKRNLPEKYFEATKTSKGARKFAATSSFDQKKEYLECLGYKFMCVISSIPNIWKPETSEMLKRMEKDQGSVEECYEKGVYISSDKKLIAALEQRSSFTSSRAYVMGLELLRSKKGQSSWSVKLNRPEIEEVYRKEARCNFFAKAVLAIDEGMDSDEMSCGLQATENRLLLYLYLHRKIYLPDDKIVSKLIKKSSKAQISNSKRKLLEELLIQRHADSRRKEYTITARGIIAVNQLLQYITESFNYQD
jgi:hypothetical protein